VAQQQPRGAATAAWRSNSRGRSVEQQEHEKHEKHEKQLLDAISETSQIDGV
jgi:hypothetical protein